MYSCTPAPGLFHSSPYTPGLAVYSRYVCIERCPSLLPFPLIHPFPLPGIYTATINTAVRIHAYVRRRKVRSKILGPHGDKGKKRAAAAGDNSSSDNYSCGNKRVRASSSSSTSTDKRLQAAQERAPAPPDCSLSDSELAEIEFKINRSPVMVLWAAVRSCPRE